MKFLISAWSSGISDPFSYIGSTRTYALTFPFNTTLSSIARIGIDQGSLIPYTDLYIGFNRLPELANSSGYDLHLAISPEPNSTVFTPQSKNGRDYPPTDAGTTWLLLLTFRFLTFKANPSSTNQLYNAAVAVWARLQVPATDLLAELPSRLLSSWHVLSCAPYDW